MNIIESLFGKKKTFNHPVIGALESQRIKGNDHTKIYTWYGSIILGNKPLQTYFKSLKQQYGNDVVKIFTDMDRHLIQKKSRPFSNIDKSRTGNVSWVPGKGYNIPIFEENAYANILNYTNQMANQLATKKFFGTNYQNAIQLIDDVSTGKVGKTADRATADTMKELMLRVTGAIELDPSRNLSPKNKEFV